MIEQGLNAALPVAYIRAALGLGHRVLVIDRTQADVDERTAAMAAGGVDVTRLDTRGAGAALLGRHYELTVVYCPLAPDEWNAVRLCVAPLGVVVDASVTPVVVTHGVVPTAAQVAASAEVVTWRAGRVGWFARIQYMDGLETWGDWWHLTEAGAIRRARRRNRRDGRVAQRLPHRRRQPR